jgi:hypothetical protein
MGMNPEVKALWLDALRSGEYKQGQGRLRKTEDDGTFSYCCLGVLCDLYIKQGQPNAAWKGDTYGGGVEYFSENEEGSTVDDYDMSLPPLHIVKWADIRNDRNQLSSHGHLPITVGGVHSELGTVEDFMTLASLNDAAEGYDFSKIAEVIEEQF